MRLTRDEILLVGLVVLILSLGAAVKAYRTGNPVAEPVPVAQPASPAQ